MSMKLNIGKIFFGGYFKKVSFIYKIFINKETYNLNSYFSAVTANDYY